MLGSDDGTGIPDYIYGVNLASGHLKALEKLNKILELSYII